MLTIPEPPLSSDFAVIAAAAQVVDVVPRMLGFHRLTIATLRGQPQVDQEPGEPLAEPRPPRVRVAGSRSHSLPFPCGAYPAGTPAPALINSSSIFDTLRSARSEPSAGTSSTSFPCWAAASRMPRFQERPCFRHLKARISESRLKLQASGIGFGRRLCKQAMHPARGVPRHQSHRLSRRRKRLEERTEFLNRFEGHRSMKRPPADRQTTRQTLLDHNIVRALKVVHLLCRLSQPRRCLVEGFGGCLPRSRRRRLPQCS